MADDTNIPTGIGASDASKLSVPGAQTSAVPTPLPTEPATPLIAGSLVMPKEPLAPAFVPPTPVPPTPEIIPQATPSVPSPTISPAPVITPPAPSIVPNVPAAPAEIPPIPEKIVSVVPEVVAPVVAPPVTLIAMPTITPAISLAVQQAVTPPPLKTIIPEDETEYERIERLKLNTDDAPHSGAISEDIAKILKEVKLPERRNFKGAADPKSPIAAAVKPVAASAKEPQKEVEAPKERSIVTALHTLKDDVQDVVRNRNMSLVRASALEQDKKHRELPKTIANPAMAQRRRRTFLMIFFSLFFIAFGCAALYGVSMVIQARAATPPPRYPSLIFAESVVTLPIDTASAASLKATIAQARAQSNAPAGSITRIIPTVTTANANGTTATTPATLQQFFTALGLQLPSDLSQGIGSTFFFGIHAVDIKAPIFVIAVNSYDRAFAGMLAWEPAMNQNLSPAYDGVSTLITGPDGLPTTRKFSDAVMSNYDVRELKDDSGKVVLYYSFPTPNLLVIAESPSSFSEILSRLEAQREL